MVTESTGPVKHGKIDTAASFNLVAAVAEKKIRLLSLFAVATTAAGTAVFNSVDSGDVATALSGAVPFDARGQINLAHNPCGWFQTVAGEKLAAVLASTGQVSGFFTYQET